MTKSKNRPRREPRKTGIGGPLIGERIIMARAA